MRSARDFKTSLLGCHRSLRAFWEREFATAPGPREPEGPPHKTVLLVWFCKGRKPPGNAKPCTQTQRKSGAPALRGHLSD